MNPVPVTSLYAALHACLFVALSARAIRGRRASRLSFGVAGAPVLERLVRAHANFAEYVPLALLLLLLVELDGGPRWLLHACGAALLAGRAAHAVGISSPRTDGRLRVAGMTATLVVMAALAAALMIRVTIG